MNNAPASSASDDQATTCEIVVCLKWVDIRPEIDPLTGEVSSDHRFSGPGPADLSALEWGYRLAESRGGTVTAVTVGPAVAETLLRDALATGAARAIRIEGNGTEASATVAARLAAVCASADSICCGVYSLDRGSGSVPAFLANKLNLPQALGLLSIAPGDKGRLVAERRLDHGRRERLAIAGRSVLSFESGPELRRASLAATLAARTTSVETVDVGERSPTVDPPPKVIDRGPYRPRPKVKPAPTGDTRSRLGTLLGNDTTQRSSQVHELEPAEAAQLVAEQLITWGYLDQPDHDSGA